MRQYDSTGPSRKLMTFYKELLEFVVTKIPSVANSQLSSLADKLKSAEDLVSQRGSLSFLTEILGLINTLLSNRNLDSALLDKLKKNYDFFIFTSPEILKEEQQYLQVMSSSKLKELQNELHRKEVSISELNQKLQAANFELTKQQNNHSIVQKQQNQFSKGGAVAQASAGPSQIELLVTDDFSKKIKELMKNQKEIKQEEPSAFQKELETACLQHNLPVSRVILTLIANAPHLVKRYERSAYDQLAHNQMIQEICWIIRYCSSNNQLHNLHHLFALKDTTMLNDILRALAAQDIIYAPQTSEIAVKPTQPTSTQSAGASSFSGSSVVKSNQSSVLSNNEDDDNNAMVEPTQPTSIQGAGASSFSGSSVVRSNQSSVLSNNNDDNATDKTSQPPEMQAETHGDINLDLAEFSSMCVSLSTLLPRTVHQNSKFDLDVLDAVVKFADDSELSEPTTDSSISIYLCMQWMDLLGAISHKIQKTNLEIQEVVARIVDAERAEDHVRITELTKELNENFKKRNLLKNNQKGVQLQLTSTFKSLNTDYQREKEQTFKRINAQLQTELRKLKEHYHLWRSQHCDSKDALSMNVTQLSATSDIDAQEEMMESLNKSTLKAIEAKECKKRVHQHIASTRDKLKDISKELGLMTLPQFGSFNTGDVNAKMTLEFLVRLANKVVEDKNNWQLAINLIALLANNAAFFTSQIQDQLLHQKDMAILLKLQIFLQTNKIAVKESDLVQLWSNVCDNQQFELLLPFKQELNLSSDQLISVIRYFAKTWTTSLQMLDVMFLRSNDPKGKVETFEALVDAAKSNNRLLEKVYMIYEAILKHSSNMIEDFFSLKGMKKLILYIESTKERFADELIFRLENIGKAPLTSDKKYSYSLARIKQLVDADLTCYGILPKFLAMKASSDANSEKSFDDFCAIVLGAFFYANPDAVHPSVLEEDKSLSIRTMDEEEATPYIASVAMAQWDKACGCFVPHSVDRFELEKKTRSRMAAQNLTEQEQLLMRLLTICCPSSDSKGAFVLTPSLVLWLPKDGINGAQAIDGAVFYTIEVLNKKTNELTSLIKQAKEIAGLNGVTLLSLPESDARVRSSAGILDQKSSQLFDSIQQVKVELVEMAKRSFTDAFPQSSVSSTLQVRFVGKTNQYFADRLQLGNGAAVGTPP